MSEKTKVRPGRKFARMPANSYYSR
jgi:hypothetical protein